MTKKFIIIPSIVIIMLIIIVVFILFFEMPMPEGAMTLKEINSARRELIKITDSNDEESARISKLKILAKKVGAGTINTKIASSDTHQWKDGSSVTNIRQNPISESELVQNINQALQTHMMFDSCRTANKQYKLAMLAAIVAVVSTFITWNISNKKV